MNEQLFLANNKLREFPEPVLGVTNLRLIHLDYNQISSVPPQVSCKLFYQ